jgi:hypothetical protein
VLEYAIEEVENNLKVVYGCSMGDDTLDGLVVEEEWEHQER